MGRTRTPAFSLPRTENGQNSVDNIEIVWKCYRGGIHMKYITPEIEIINFKAEDVVRTSDVDMPTPPEEW